MRWQCKQSGRDTIKTVSSIVKSGEIFSTDVQCKKNDRLVTMHTSDHCRSVLYEIQRLDWFRQSAMSFTGEQEEKKRFQNLLPLHRFSVTGGTPFYRLVTSVHVCNSATCDARRKEVAHHVHRSRRQNISFTVSTGMPFCRSVVFVHIHNYATHDER